MKSITKQTKILADKWTKEMQADLEYHCEHLKMNPKPLSKYAIMLQDLFATEIPVDLSGYSDVEPTRMKFKPISIEEVLDKAEKDFIELDICPQCLSPLKWIDLYLQCTDCKRIYG